MSSSKTYGFVWIRTFENDKKKALYIVVHSGLFILYQNNKLGWYRIARKIRLTKQFQTLQCCSSCFVCDNVSTMFQKLWMKYFIFRFNYPRKQERLNSNKSPTESMWDDNMLDSRSASSFGFILFFFFFF